MKHFIYTLFLLAFIGKNFAQVATLQNIDKDEILGKVTEAQVIPINFNGHYLIHFKKPLGYYLGELVMINPETGIASKKIKMPEYKSYDIFSSEAVSSFVTFKNNVGILYSKKSGKGIELAIANINSDLTPPLSPKTLLTLLSSEYVISDISEDQSVFVIGSSRVDKSTKTKIYTIVAFDQEWNKIYSDSIHGDKEFEDEKFMVLAYNGGVAISLSKESGSILKLFNTSTKTSQTINLPTENKCMLFWKLRALNNGKIVAGGMYGSSTEESFRGFFKLTIDLNNNTTSNYIAFEQKEYLSVGQSFGKISLDCCDALILENGDIYFLAFMRDRKDFSNFYFSVIGIHDIKVSWNNPIPIPLTQKNSRVELTPLFNGLETNLFEWNNQAYLSYTDHRKGIKAKNLNHKHGDQIPFAFVDNTTKKDEIHQVFIKFDNLGKMESSVFDGIYSNYRETHIPINGFIPVLGYFYPNGCAIANFKLN